MVFLIGSTPVAPLDGRWKTEALQQSAASAQELWFITPFGFPGPLTILRIATTVETKGHLPAGQSLSAKLSPDGRARMARLAARYGIDTDKLDRMTPWYADVTVALAVHRKDGTMQGWVAQLPEDVGFKGVQAALALIAGEAVDPVISTGFLVITKDNLQESRVQALLAGG